VLSRKKKTEKNPGKLFKIGDFEMTRVCVKCYFFKNIIIIIIIITATTCTSTTTTSTIIIIIVSVSLSYRSDF